MDAKPCFVTLEARVVLAREKARLRSERWRRAHGIGPRRPAQRPWLAEGVSRSTWYRRGGKIGKRSDFSLCLPSDCSDAMTREQAGKIAELSAVLGAGKLSEFSVSLGKFRDSCRNLGAAKLSDLSERRLGASKLCDLSHSLGQAGKTPNFLIEPMCGGLGAPTLHNTYGPWPERRYCAVQHPHSEKRCVSKDDGQRRTSEIAPIGHFHLET
jgi:hypothetical protein